MLEKSCEKTHANSLLVGLWLCLTIWKNALELCNRMNFLYSFYFISESRIPNEEIICTKVHQQLIFNLKSYQAFLRNSERLRDLFRITYPVMCQRWDFNPDLPESTTSNALLDWAMQLLGFNLKHINNRRVQCVTKDPKQHCVIAKWWKQIMCLMTREWHNVLWYTVLKWIYKLIILEVQLVQLLTLAHVLSYSFMYFTVH